MFAPTEFADNDMLVLLLLLFPFSGELIELPVLDVDLKWIRYQQRKWTVKVFLNLSCVYESRGSKLNCT